MAEANHSQADADYREHRDTYVSFLQVAKWGLIGCVLILVLVLWALHQL